MAGYEKQMNEFLRMNDGLTRRIRTRMTFKAYSLQELRDIFLRILRDKGDRIVADPDLKEAANDDSVAVANLIVDDAFKLFIPQVFVSIDLIDRLI